MVLNRTRPGRRSAPTWLIGLTAVMLAPAAAVTAAQAGSDLAAATTGPRPAAPTPESLVRLAAISEPRIAPGGEQIAFVLSDSLDPRLAQIWLIDNREGARPHPFTAGGGRAHTPRWSPDGRQLLFLTARGDTAAEQVQIIDLDGGESRPVTREPNGVADMEWSPDGTRLACVVPGGPARAGDPADQSIRPPGSRLRVRDMVSGETITISPDTANVWNFAWSPDGARVAVLFTRPGSFGEWRRGMLAIVDADGRGWRRIPGRFDPIQGVAWSPDGARLAACAMPATEYTCSILHVMNSDGSNLRRLAAPDLPETDTGVWWTAAGGLIVNAHAGVRCFITRIDPDSGERTRLAGRWADLGTDLSVARDGQLAWTSAGPDHPGDLYRWAPTEPRALRLTFVNPQLLDRPWIEPQPVTWTSFDGRRIEGILFTPSGPYHAPFPTIVIPHGGPAWHWSLGFFADAHNPAQLLAARGYACFLPNPRGSTGYGEAFNALNRGDLGGGDFRDIEAGVDSLIAAGLADSARLAIGGFSYGGYMSAWSVAHTRRYRCAIVGAGPMDFLSDYSQNDLTPYWQQEYLGGSPWNDPTNYLARSVMTYVGRIACPVLIVHGSDDIRVPAAQSRELYTALRERKVPVEFLLYPREGHGFNDPAHQIDFAKRQLTWYERWLTPAREKRRH